MVTYKLGNTQDMRSTVNISYTNFKPGFHPQTEH